MSKVAIHESRRLMLPLETAVDAVLEFDREHGGCLAYGAVVSALIDEGPEPHLVLEILLPNTIAAAAHRYNLTAVAAAFVHYCWRARIPLPRNGVKRITVVPEGFAMTIESTLKVLRLHGPMPKSRAQRGDAVTETGVR